MMTITGCQETRQEHQQQWFLLNNNIKVDGCVRLCKGCHNATKAIMKACCYKYQCSKWRDSYLPRWFVCLP
ncbi:hypothetical protein FRX31_014733 [Thalictrum thalictroides]|uniref:Uncharacterized protein n=1 Tax=Thalictrum thalictroides TaxID=46969 RepID=A0A7J6WGC9_THATH|nr:hypothetical protein FRX31_014733 [Thalictrum thalictroides]